MSSQAAVSTSSTARLSDRRQAKHVLGARLRAPAIYLSAAVAVGFSLLPFYVILTTALKTTADVFTFPPRWLFRPTLDNFRDAFVASGGGGVLPFLVNSIIVTAASTALTLVLGAMAAYALARSTAPSSKHIAFYVLSTRFAPPIAFIVPLFILIRNVGLLDTHVALVLLYINMNLPLVVWVLRGFFREIPIELEEAAYVDGYTRGQIFMRVVLPLAKSGLTSIAILTAIFSWNEFLFAALLTQQRAATLPVYLSSFSGSIGINWGEYMAVGFLAILPIMIFTLAMQKHLVRGLSFGTVK